MAGKQAIRADDASPGYATQPRVERPEEASALLDSALLFAVADGNLSTFLLNLRTVVAARGWTTVAREAKVSREHLHRALSGQGNPEVRTITAVLAALGLRLAVAELTKEDAAYATAG